MLKAVDLLCMEADSIEDLPTGNTVGCVRLGQWPRDPSRSSPGRRAGLWKRGNTPLAVTGVELRLGKGAGQGFVELLVGFPRCCRGRHSRMVHKVFRITFSYLCGEAKKEEA